MTNCIRDVFFDCYVESSILNNMLFGISILSGNSLTGRSPLPIFNSQSSKGFSEGSALTRCFLLRGKFGSVSRVLTA